ncbi:unnamed protein product [Paramecium primaurelia]|uniref:G domain-containing protein n=1 Tax=Paramecium primaurelia TaxID=5886 RepID=A0A8S1PDP8_PARPR|nr:unnamed protein product [Paramecium primaurelia]
MSFTFIIQEHKQRILEQLNYRKDENRQQQLDQYLDRLNKLGFYVELLPSIEPKFFVEKQGFSIKEALILTRGRHQARPNDEEIQKLEFDKETNILKLEYQDIAFEGEQNYSYILILGPPNRGKTTFIFNIINKIFNVQYNSMYRVKKKQDQIRGYYDEYHIRIQNKNYVFVDFRGIGDLKLDFLGLDQSGNSNIYVEILEYLQKNASIAAIFYVNSSSINRLSEDESYCLQRFFELIPNKIINQHKFFLILTYCTDNTPKMTIYEQSNSTPEDLKNLLKKEMISEREKFWYGINNKPLYEPVINSDEQNQINNQPLQEQEIKFNEQNDKNIQLDNLLRNFKDDQFLEPEQNVNDGKFLGQQELNEQDERAEVEIEETQLGKFQYNQMTSVISEIISKIQIANNNIDNEFNKQYFKQQLSFEKNIIELLKIYRLSSQGLILDGLNIEQFQTTYLAYEMKNSNERFQIRQGSKLLYCGTCNIQCHENCRFKRINDMSDTNICRMFVKNNKGIFVCKKCKKHDPQKECTVGNHQLIDQTGDIYKKTLVSMIILENYDQIKKKMPQNKQSKAIYRLKQTAVIKAKLIYQNQIKVIRNQNKQNKNQNCIPIDLNQREKYLNAMMNQLKNNNQNGDEFYKKLEEVNQIYYNLVENDKSNQKQDPQIEKKSRVVIPELELPESNNSQQNLNNEISFRQSDNQQVQQQIDEQSPQKNFGRNSAYFNNSNERQPLISDQ